ncbi:hypothetical protein GCM10022408_26250 [Hymenobacter fastidiosus]|uniref:Helix-turn-helix domain-containing protein n=2 Tax=Hymenobacter fastidiosus TaxID=486264 RepID=A0ABP7SIR6_9BACT
MQVLHVSRMTVYAWFTRWETGGLAGRANAAGQGRPPVLTAAAEQRGQAAVRANRQPLKKVTATLRQELNKGFSPRMLKRFLKAVVGRGAGSATG